MLQNHMVRNQKILYIIDSGITYAPRTWGVTSAQLPVVACQVAHFLDRQAADAIHSPSIV